jgi:hypothetical protein
MRAEVKTGNLVASTVILIWGAGVLVYALSSGGPHGGSSYQTGQVVALVFALVMVFAGGRGLRNELRKRRS